MPHIAIATCAKAPDLQPSDAVFARELEARGASVNAAPWNDPYMPFERADAVIIRSTWDYFPVPDEFCAWLDRLAKRPHVFNDPLLMRWNMGKLYLFELQAKGARIPETVRAAPDADAIAEAMDALNINEAIVKPVYGGTASGLSKVRRDDRAGLRRAAETLAGPGLVQQFMPDITGRGETSLVFIDGIYSHAVVKRPKKGDIRVQSDHGGSVAVIHPPDWAIAEAANILACAPAKTLYARMDAIISGRDMTLMEAELVEPELFFTYCPEAAARLADALLARLS